ncbi:LOW QUALITY PROTEIN: hypothetical protein Nmel_008772 [Mimus melanotis]
MPGVPGPERPRACEPDYTSRRAPRGGAGGRRGAAAGLASAVCLLPAAPVRECQPGGGTRRPPRPRLGRDRPTDRPTDRGRDRRTQRPREEPRARSGPGPHERAVSGEYGGRGSFPARRDPAMDWLMGGAPLCVPPGGALPARPRRPRCRAARAPPPGGCSSAQLSAGRPWALPPAGTAGCAAALVSSRALALWKSNFSSPFCATGGPGVAAVCASRSYSVGLIPLRQNIALNRKACQGLNGFLWGGRRDLGRD